MRPLANSERLAEMAVTNILRNAILEGHQVKQRTTHSDLEQLRDTIADWIDANLFERFTIIDAGRAE